MRVIYGLFDPRDWEAPLIRYVGQTKKLAWRMVGHCQDTTRSEIGDWIWELKKVGLVPSVVALEMVDDDWAAVAERKWINKFPNGQLFNKLMVNSKSASLVKMGRIREMEKELIRTVLEECNGNKSKAAKVLGIGRPALYRKMEVYKI